MEPSPKPVDTTSAAPKKRGKGLWIGIAAIVLIVIIGIAAYYYLMPPAANISIVDDGKCSDRATYCQRLTENAHTDGYNGK